jgi:pathogenesis-related protein 1
MRHVVNSAVVLFAFALASVVALAGPPPLKGGAGGRPNGTAAPHAQKGVIGSNLSVEEKRSLMSLHNQLRADVGVARLTWSPELATFAQQWADHLAATSRSVEHRPTSGTWKQLYGENIYMGTASPTAVADAMAMWENEKALFKGQPLSTSDLRSLHYSQIVWQATTQVGCAAAQFGNNVIVVCNYAPAGNTIGQKAY